MNHYLVVDNEFNRHWYPDYVGKVFNSPPAYMQVQVLDNNLLLAYHIFGESVLEE